MINNSVSLFSLTLCFAIQIFLTPAKAQSLKSFDKVEIQTLYINAKDSLVRFQVLSENKNNKFEPSLVYYWYKSNAILKTTGGGDGKLLNGEYTCFYPDNNLKEKGKFLKGLKNESWLSWYEDGNLKDMWTWKKGKLHGIHDAYSRDGKIVTNEKYKNGVLRKKKEKKVKVPDSDGEKVQKEKSKVNKPSADLKKAKEKKDAEPVKEVKKKKTDKSLPERSPKKKP